MGVAGRDIDDPKIFAPHWVFNDLIAVQVAKSNHSLTLKHQEFFGFGVVVVVATSHTRRSAGDKDLAKCGGFGKFSQTTSGVAFLVQFIAEVVFRQIGKIGSVEFSYEGIAEIGNIQGVAGSREGADQGR